MAKPVGRSTIIMSKLAAAFANIVMVNLVSLGSSIVMVHSFNKGEGISGEIIMFMLSMFLVQLIFLALGAALAAGLRNAKSSGSIVTGILLIGFVISRITDMTDRLNFLNVLSPFKYYSYTNIVNGAGLNLLVVVLSLMLIAALLVWAFVSYQRRDAIRRPMF